MMNWFIPGLLVAMTVWTAWMWRGMANLERTIAVVAVGAVTLTLLLK